MSQRPDHPKLYTQLPDKCAPGSTTASGREPPRYHRARRNRGDADKPGIRSGHAGDVLGRVIAGVAAALRLSRWRGCQTSAEPLLLILHIGYGWLVFGLLLLGMNGLTGALPAIAALHALTVGAIGTRTLAVMTRATLGHTGRALVAGPVTQAIFGLVTIAAILRVLSPFAGAQMQLALRPAAGAWSGAFGLFALSYGGALVQPRIGAAAGRPI